MNMNLLLKNNSSPIIIIFFLSIIFVSCAIQKIEIPKPNLTMANKIQFDAESKEVWVYDFQGQGHYFNHATKNVINAFNNKTENINSQTFQLYCNYHTYNEMVFIEEKSVSVFKSSFTESEPVSSKSTVIEVSFLPILNGSFGLQ